MATPRRAVIIGLRRVINDPKAKPAQILRAVELYREEKGAGYATDKYPELAQLAKQVGLDV